MLVWLSDFLMQFDSNFAVLQYITVRGIFSVLTALGVSLLIGKRNDFFIFRHKRIYLDFRKI